MYTQEAEEQRIKVDQLLSSSSSAEEWDIKNGRKMLDESLRMISRGQTLLSAAVSDLQELVEAAKSEAEITEDDADLKAARDALKNAGVDPDAIPA